MTLLRDLFDYSDGLPHWLRPVFWGAVLVLGHMVLRAGTLYGGIAIAALVIIAQFGLTGLLQAVGIVLIAIGAGAAGGVLYSLLRPIRRVGLVGVWLTSVAATAAYLVVIVWGLRPYGFLSDEPLTLKGMLILLSVAAPIFGTFLSYLLGRDAVGEARSPKPRQPSPSELLTQAYRDELEDLRQRATTEPKARLELEAILAETPSAALVTHWWRVTGRLSRGNPVPSYRLRTALHLATRRRSRVLRDYRRLGARTQQQYGGA